MSRLLPGVAAFAAAMLVALMGLYANADTPGEPPPEGGIVKLRLLGVNDFHGHLEPPRPGIGGAAWLKSHLDRATVQDRTIRVHAGDMVGASPLISSHFKDEPTMEAANHFGFDVGTVGNHEFDEGGEELLRLLQLSHYPYIAANSRLRDGGRAPAAPLRDRRAGGRARRLHRGHDALHAEVPPQAPRGTVPLHGHLGSCEPLGPRAAPS